MVQQTMKSNNRWSAVLVAVIAVSQAAAPLAAFAQTRGTPRHGDAGPAGETIRFCATLDARAGGLRGRITGLKKNIDDRHQDIVARIAEKEASRDEKLSELRVGIGKKLDDRIVRFREKATTDAQKTAVDAFATAIHNAVSERKTAMDAAKKMFRDGLEAARVSRKSAVNAATTAFAAAVQAALDKAKADCAASGDPIAIRATMTADTEAARKKLQADMKAADRVGDDLNTLNKTRKAAFKKAQADFRTAVEVAVHTLRAVFPEAHSDAGEKTDK